MSDLSYQPSPIHRMSDIFDSSDASPPQTPASTFDPEPYTPTIVSSSLSPPISKSSVDITEVVDTRSPIQPGALTLTPEPYSPGRPGIKIVKRKPAPIYDPTIKREKVSTDEDQPTTVYLLSLKPSKSILCVAPPEKRAKKTVNFSDTNGLPLVHIREIPSLKAIAHHCNNEDLRNFEAKEERFVSKLDADIIDWTLIELIAPERKNPIFVSKTAEIEEKRIRELGIFRGAIFKDTEIIDSPHLYIESREALRRPIPQIPLDSAKTLLSKGSLIKQLPLPGNLLDQPSQHQEKAVYQQCGYQDQSRHYADYNSPSYSSSKNTYQQKSLYSNDTYRQEINPPIIRQIFENEPEDTTSQYRPVFTENVYKQEPYIGTSEYHATTSFQSLPSAPETSQKSDVSATNSKTATEVVSTLPPTLRAMLDQLKTKGYVSSGDSPPHQTTSGQYDNQYDLQYDQQLNGLDSGIGGYQASFSGPPQISADEPAYPVLNPVQQGDKWVQSAWKIPEPCTYFVYRAGGCVRGDQCRFVHDEEMKEKLLRDKKFADSNELGPYDHQPRHDRGGGPFSRAGRNGGGGGGGGGRGGQYRNAGGFRGGQMRNGNGDRGFGRGGRFNGGRRDYGGNDRRNRFEDYEIGGRRDHRFEERRERELNRIRERREERDERDKKEDRPTPAQVLVEEPQV